MYMKKMKKTLKTAILCGLLLAALTGCRYEKPTPSVEYQPEGFRYRTRNQTTTTTAVEVIAEDTDTEDIFSEDIITEAPTSVSTTSVTTAKTTVKTTVPTTTKKAASTTKPRTTTKAKTTKATTSTRAKTTASTTKSTAKTTVKTTQKTTAATTAKPADFDINDWVSYAQNYAKSVGLRLDNDAVYCWDNPIAAGPNCIYTERDIKDCLNRYAADRSIKAVWIWYSRYSDTSYNLYVGYA